MPSVLLTFSDDLVDVHDAEVPVLRSQGLLRAVDGVPEPGCEPAVPSEPDDQKEQ